MSLNAYDELGMIGAELRRTGSGSKRDHLLARRRKLNMFTRENSVFKVCPPTQTHKPQDFDEKVISNVGRLRSIEREIDSDDMTARKRKRLKRLRKGLRRKIAGKDPRAFVNVGIGGIPEEKRNAYEEKKAVLQMLDKL